MKKIVFLIAAVFTLSVFTGCDAFSEYEEILPETEQEETSDDTKPEDEDKADSDDPDPSEPEPPAPPLEEKGMPVIYITPESGNTDFITEPISKVVGKSAPEPYYVDCNITVVNKYEQTELSDSPAEVKVRGNWTTNYDKKP